MHVTWNMHKHACFLSGFGTFFIPVTCMLQHMHVTCMLLLPTCTYMLYACYMQVIYVASPAYSCLYYACYMHGIYMVCTWHMHSLCTIHACCMHGACVVYIHIIVLFWWMECAYMQWQYTIIITIKQQVEQYNNIIS